MQTHFVFDFDSTLVRTEILEVLAQAVLESNPMRERILAKLRDITVRGMEGSISFTESLSQRLALLRLRREHVMKVSGILLTHISPSVIRCKEAIVRSSGNIYVVSGGFRECMLPVTRELGIRDDHVFSNQFIWNGNEVVGFDRYNPLSKSEGKSCIVKKLRLSGNIIGVGDGYTDYEMKKTGAVTYFIAYTENVLRRRVVELADEQVDCFEKLPLDK